MIPCQGKNDGGPALDPELDGALPRPGLRPGLPGIFARPRRMGRQGRRAQISIGRPCCSQASTTVHPSLTGLGHSPRRGRRPIRPGIWHGRPGACPVRRDARRPSESFRSKDRFPCGRPAPALAGSATSAVPGRHPAFRRPCPDPGKSAELGARSPATSPSTAAPPPKSSVAPSSHGRSVRSATRPTVSPRRRSASEYSERPLFKPGPRPYGW